MKNLNNEEREAILKASRRVTIDFFKRNPLKTKNSLIRLLRFGLNDIINVPEKKNCNDESHCAPFDFVYDVLVNGVTDYIVWANRSGSKTYYAGFITWIQSFFYDGLETNLLGGSETQSLKAYEALSDFWNITDLDRYCLKKAPMISYTIWKNRSKVSILTASQTSVRGPHVQRLILDEVDEMDEAIHEAALSQTQEKHGLPGGIGELSTNHKVNGVMDLAIEKAKGTSVKLYKWCVWECLESCKDYDCSTCKLTAWCPGKQMKQATGYYKITDFIKKLERLNLRSLQVEWFCQKIGSPDLIYFEEFDEEIHFIGRGFEPSKPVFISIDWGGTNPFSLGAWQEFPGLGWVRIDEIYINNTTNDELIKEAKKRPWWKHIRGGVADPSRSDLKRTWAKEKIFLIGANNEIEPGIEAVKTALKPVIGNPKIFFNKFKCKFSRGEFLSYSQKNGKIKKENDHAMDEIRYFVMWKLNKLNTETKTILRKQREKKDFFKKNEND